MSGPERPAPSVPSARPVLVLASASPARLATLRSAGIDPVVVVSGVDESVVTETDPASYVTELSRLKARAVLRRLGEDPPDPDPDPEAGRGRGDWVLGCDSVLALDEDILGKPTDAAEVVRRWRRMRGRTGVLHTGHCLVDGAGEREDTRAVATTVHFADVDDEEIEAYAATGEPLVVAGAFTIDGLGGAFVRGVEGDHHNVVGISLPVLREMFAERGVRWTDLWTVGDGPG